MEGMRLAARKADQTEGVDKMDEMETATYYYLRV